MTRVHTDISPVPVAVAPSSATAGTTLGVTLANAAILPDVYPWWSLAVPTGQKPTRSNSEIMKMVSASDDATYRTYTMVRAQGIPVTTAQSITTGFDIYDANSVEVRNLLNMVPSTDHSADGIFVILNANEAQAFGDIVYIDVDGQAHLADADAIATSKVVAMCVDASISANADGRYMLLGTARDDTWAWTVAGHIYLTVTGTTGNTLSQTPPTGTDDCVVLVGVATHADRMFFNPSPNIAELV